MRTVYLEGTTRKRTLGGAITSLIKPFHNDAVDRTSLETHVAWQIASGIDGLVACGLAGEGPTLTEGERSAVIAICVETASGRVPIIAATGSNCTRRTIEATRQALSAGASAALITVPYYSKPTQQGIVAHFESIADATDLPVIIDNRPAHTGINLAPATIEKLGAIGSVVGLCDAGGDIGRSSGWAQLLPQRIGLYTSNDAAALAFGLTGAAGCFSDAANVAPQQTAALQHQAAAGNLAAALRLQERLGPLWQALAAEGGPAGLKQALWLDSQAVRPDVRLPLVGVGQDTVEAIGEALALLHSLEHPATTVVTDGPSQSVRL